MRIKINEHSELARRQIVLPALLLRLLKKKGNYYYIYYAKEIVGDTQKMCRKSFDMQSLIFVNTNFDRLNTRQCFGNLNKNGYIYMHILVFKYYCAKLKYNSLIKTRSIIIVLTLLLWTVHLLQI